MNYYLVKGDSEIHIGKSEEGRQFMFDISDKGMGLQPEEMSVVKIWNYLTHKVGECYRIVNEYDREFSRIEFLRMVGGELMPTKEFTADGPVCVRDGTGKHIGYISPEGIYFSTNMNE